MGEAVGRGGRVNLYKVICFDGRQEAGGLTLPVCV